MIVKPFDAKPLDDIFSIYTLSDLTKPEGVCEKISNKIRWINAPHYFSTSPDKTVFTNTIIFDGVVPRSSIENKNIILIVKDAAKFYQNCLINEGRISLHRFDGTISIGTHLRWKSEMSTLDVFGTTTLEYTEKSITCLSRAEITNLQKVVRLIIGNFENKYCDECAYYTQLFYALSFENETFDFLARINSKVSSHNMGVPMIERVVYNAPNTVVFWKDGTSTTVTATEGEEFNKEIGLAMAISRKYFAVREDNPRAAFKNVVKNADDYTAASEHKRQQKERKLQKKRESENGHDADI